MFSIAAWKQGVQILHNNPNIGYRELGRELNIDVFEARALINNYCDAFKVKRKKKKKLNKQSDTDLFLTKLYSHGKKKRNISTVTAEQ